MTANSPVTPGTSALLESPPAPGPSRAAPPPEIEPEPAGTGERVLVGVFVVVPFLAVLAAIPLAWGWGLGWRDLVIALAFYVVAGLGIAVGFHRFFTHKSFKATRPTRIGLAIAGSLAIEGPVLTWVADHRRHHKYSDKEGDPHSPWRFGDDWKALTKGLLYAHMGWMFNANRTSQERFCPDLLADSDMRRVSGAFPAIVAISLLLPALIGGLWSMSWQGALERRVAGDRLLRRVMAQPAPRGPHLCTPRRAQRADRPGCQGYLGAGEARARLRRAVAGRRSAHREANRLGGQETRLHGPAWRCEPAGAIVMIEW